MRTISASFGVALLAAAAVAATDAAGPAPAPADLNLSGAVAGKSLGVAAPHIARRSKVVTSRGHYRRRRRHGRTCNSATLAPAPTPAPAGSSAGQTSSRRKTSSRVQPSKSSTSAKSASSTSTQPATTSKPTTSKPTTTNSTTSTTTTKKTTSSSPRPSPTPSGGGLGALEQECLDTHNSFRAEIGGLQPLSWSRQLQDTAQSWANTLVSERSFHHSGFDFGENLFQTTNGDMSCRAAIQAWFDERSEYDGQPISDDEQFHKYGHYTQVVWPATRQVGCAQAGFTSGRNKVLNTVCEYNPPGNIIGQVAPR